MNVLMLGWEFPPALSGGLGTACSGLTRGLIDAGARVALVLPTLSGRESAPGVELLAADARARDGDAASDTGGARAGLDVLAVASPLRPYAADTPRAGAGGPYGPELLAEARRYADAVEDLAGARRFDVVHAHDWMTWVAGLRVRRRSGRPLVVHVHSCERDRAMRADPRIERIERLGVRAADRVVCVSRYTAERVRRLYGVGGERVRVVHNGVEPFVPPPAPAAFVPAAEREPLVAFLGRLTQQKGLDFLLAAARQVVVHEPRARFVVCGDGALLPELVERTARLRLARHVRFAGFLGRDGVRALLARSAALVMPSVSEPFGLVALEAAAAGVPVVVSRQSGVGEVLRHALRVDFWQVDDLAEKILALVRRPALRVALTEGAAGEARRLGWPRAARAVLDVYREVVP